MKRLFVVAAVAGMLAALGSQAWAVDMCLWNGAGDCWKLSEADRSNCAKNAWIFDGGKEGEGTFCSGGTFTGTGKSTTPPSGSGGPVVSLGCCKWETETKCWDIYDATEKTDCSGGDNVFYEGACPDKEGTCPGGSVTPPTTKEMCLWNAGGDCWEVPSSDGKTVADCEATAWHFSGGKQGEGSFCEGGTFVAGKTDTPPQPGGNTTPLGCCKWSTETLCWDVYEEKDVTDCGYSENQFWNGACPDKQGTCPSGPPDNGGGGVDGVKLLNSKAVAPGLKVSYAKNRVTVNWTPTAKIAKGTVQLINAKGVALSTAFIKDNSSKVSVKLGTVGVPAGMYFIHINAVGQNGKKIVTQSAISIVK